MAGNGHSLAIIRRGRREQHAALPPEQQADWISNKTTQLALLADTRPYLASWRSWRKWAAGLGHAADSASWPLIEQCLQAPSKRGASTPAVARQRFWALSW